MAITKKQVLKTVLLPGILPRIGELFGSGFSTLAYLIAVVYNTVRILPNNHPYLRSDMIGKYSVRQVIGEASNHITPNKKNIDQIIIFFSIIAALIIMVIQFVLLVIAMAIPKAEAAATLPTTIEGFFKTPNPKEDIAYRMLDLVFGVPKFFGSNDDAPTTLHLALHSLFEFYSYGILIVGAMIIVYFVVAVVAETAQSGTPFGQRFNKAWAPIRVILFFGLLLPISNGLNGGQYITLASAKLGSSLASTGWVLFNDKIDETNKETLTGKKEQNVAIPNASDLSYIPAFLLVAKTCKVSYDKIYTAYDKTNNPLGFPATWGPGSDTGVQAWAVYNTSTPTTNGATEISVHAEKMEGTTFTNLEEKSKGADIAIVFGVKDDKEHKIFPASVAPICGQLVLRVTDVSEKGSAYIHQAYYDLIIKIWNDPELNTFAENYVKRNLNIHGYKDPTAALPDDKYIQKWKTFLTEYMEKDKDGVIAKAVEEQINHGDWQMPPKMKELGWGGAGIWYNTVAKQNGALIAALRGVPIIQKYPRVFEETKALALKENQGTKPEEIFKPNQSANASTPSHWFSGEDRILDTLNLPYGFWILSEFRKDTKTTGNQVIDTINLILGTSGLFEICKNTNIHPLAQLSAVGKSMLDSSINAFGLSALLGVGSPLLGAFGLGTAASSASKFFGTISSIGLLAGFLLFYILPFMPFIYFFFAVGGWVKGIFEAMVAMPLWALAHLRIDGEGIPGEAAIGGYFLIFEIFIRPILIVVGLLAAVSVFAAMVKVLNEVFYIVVSNLSGHDPKSSSTNCFQAPATSTGTGAKVDPAFQNAELKDAFRGPVDEFFFTILYTIIVYMIGTSCFKLIDLIPNNILRFINAEVPSFNDSASDPAEGLMQYATLAGSQFGQQIGGGISQMGSGAKESINQFANLVKK